MAVITNETNTFPREDCCFACNEPIADAPYIYWQGGNGKAIGLHIDCAEYLGTNLLNDFRSHQAACAGRLQNVVS